jgi:small nuclear ribonucleoprotein D1
MLLAYLVLSLYLAQHFRRGKTPKSYATLSVRGSTMRGWLLPESLNLDALLVDTDVETAKPVVPQVQQPRARGRGRGRGARR